MRRKKRRLKGRREPLERSVGMDRVEDMYLLRLVSRTASLVERARPEEKAILARVVSSLPLFTLISDGNTGTYVAEGYTVTGLPLEILFLSQE